MTIFAKTILMGGLLAYGLCAQTTWTDISTAKVGTLGTQSYPGGVAGTCVNRLTGDVFINIVGLGIFRSADQGATWTSYSGNTISGRCENGWGVQVCQDNPSKMAVFSLDGDAGYTLDGGKTWKKFTQVWGRNWDYGSVDWNDPQAKTIMAMDHENGGKVRVSTDGGGSWTLLSITLSTDVWGSGPMTIGVMDNRTLIHSDANGLSRSSDLGQTWTQVSSEKPTGKVVVLFKGKHYLGTPTGLIVSADQGLTWKHQGASLNIYQGPYFGACENQMVVAGTSGIYQTTDGGAAWTKIGDFPTQSSQGFSYNVLWFGANAWDPINGKLYATAMANPAFKMNAPSVQPCAAGAGRTASTSMIFENSGVLTKNNILYAASLIRKVQVFDLSGKLLAQKECSPVYAFPLSGVFAPRNVASIYRVTTISGTAIRVGR